jgi:hypothetical protein
MAVDIGLATTGIDIMAAARDMEIIAAGVERWVFRPAVADRTDRGHPANAGWPFIWRRVRRYRGLSGRLCHVTNSKLSADDTLCH